MKPVRSTPDFKVPTSSYHGREESRKDNFTHLQQRGLEPHSSDQGQKTPAREYRNPVKKPLALLRVMNGKPNSIGGSKLGDS